MQATSVSLVEHMIDGFITGNHRGEIFYDSNWFRVVSLLFYFNLIATGLHAATHFLR